VAFLRRPHKGEVPLNVIADLPGDATEVARLWVNSERSYVAIGLPDGWSPELFGSLLVECVHTAAWAYADVKEKSVEEVLQAIWSGFDEERERLSDVD
jgi:hypothetical protein